MGNNSKIAFIKCTTRQLNHGPVYKTQDEILPLPYYKDNKAGEKKI